LHREALTVRFHCPAAALSALRARCEIIVAGRMQLERHGRITGKPILPAVFEKGFHVGDVSMLDISSGLR
jgi:hypothetical protein